MEKATRALRRSGVKLLSMGGANSDLSVTLSEVKNMRSSGKAFMCAQNLASGDMLRWAAHEENTAIQDIINQMSELNLLWTEVQTEFLDSLKEYKQMFEMILAGEKQVFLAKQNYNVCEQKETKYRKELKRLVKKGGLESEIRMLHSRVQQAERSKELAYSELSDKAKENECIKLMRLKGGLLKASEAYIEMSTKCSLLFTAQRDVVLQLPEVNGQDLDDLKYTGRTTTRYVVDQARNQIKKYRTNSQTGTNLNEPPPPYTPTPPDSSPNLSAEQLIVPVRNPTPPGPRARQSSRSTPPPYEQVDSSPSPTSDHRRLERRSLPAAFSSGSEHSLSEGGHSLTESMPSMPSGGSTGSIVSPHGTMPQPSSRVISRPTQESCGRKSDTLPRTGSGRRNIPRNPAPPIPQPRSTSASSTDSSSLSSSENLAQADRKPAAESCQSSSCKIFRFDSQDVAVQSQNATYQSESLYSCVRSNSPVHVCPSGLSRPSVSETSTSQNAHTQNVEVEHAISDSSTVNEDTNVMVENQDSGSVSQCGKGEASNTRESGTNNTGSSFAGIPESGLGMGQPAECLIKTGGNPHEDDSSSQSKNDLQNIPFIDSMNLELSPEKCLIQTQDMHNIQNDQGTKFGAAFEAGDVVVQGVHNKETRKGDSDNVNLEEDAKIGILETDLDAIEEGKPNKTTSNAEVGDKQLSDISSKPAQVSDDLIDFGDYDEDYDTADEENVTVGAVGGAH